MLDILKKTQSRMSELMEKSSSEKLFIIGCGDHYFQISYPPFLPPLSQVISFFRAYKMVKAKLASLVTDCLATSPKMGHFTSPPYQEPLPLNPLGPLCPLHFPPLPPCRLPSRAGWFQMVQPLGETLYPHRPCTPWLLGS